MAKKFLKLGTVLKTLLFEKNMKPVDLAREVNLPPPTIHRLVTGKSTRPYQSSLQPIADFFSVTIEQLIGEQPLLANRNTSNTSVATMYGIPFIPFESVHRVNQIDTLKHDEKIFAHNVGEGSFATTLSDSSMEPIFARGSILIFDPNKQHKDRSYVLVRLHESNVFVFRQLLIDVDNKYLKPLNPDLNTFKMKLLSDKDEIIATLIEARQSYHEH